MTATTTKLEALAVMAEWRDYRGLSPFAGAKAGFAVDRCNEYLANANAILSMLSAACEDSQYLLDKREDSQFDMRVGALMAGALDGVGNLIDLAAFMLDGGKPAGNAPIKRATPDQAT